VKARHPYTIWKFAVTLVFAAAAVSAQEEKGSRMPTWQDETAKGFVPYHQLTLEDFRIDDKAHPESVYWVRPFIHPFWHFIWTRRDWYYAYVDQWVVFSGLNKNESSRQSTFRDMQKSLPHAQAYLDLYEIHARQLAALTPGELPSGRGATPEEAGQALRQNMDAFLKERYKLIEAEATEFQKATDHGSNKKKVRELGAAIRKRLEAIPAPAGPAYQLPNASPSPSASPTAGPAGGP